MVACGDLKGFLPFMRLCLTEGEAKGA